MDTAVSALAASQGKVWVMSTEKDVSLHAVNPVTLTDELDHAAIVARAPALAAGIHVDPGEDLPVAVLGHELLFRLESGAWTALDPATLQTRDLGFSGAEADELRRQGGPRGNPAVEALVQARPSSIDPRVVPVFDPDGNPDPGASYVVSQTTLDRDAAEVKLTRWDPTGTTPVEGWTTTFGGVHPECCDFRAWRTDGTVVLWYEDWLIAVDDATGATRWKRRL